MEEKSYQLPRLLYGYDALEPYLSSELLTLHHDKHHQAYVAGANAVLAKLEQGRKDGSEPQMKILLKEFSFHLGGHILHSLFWENLCPPDKSNMPRGPLLSAIKYEFGSFERFKKEFSQAALSVEGSGWATLSFDPMTKRLLIIQIEKHNTNLVPGLPVLLVLDVWEHAYYLDYQNDRAKFIEAFWQVVNWDEVEKRFTEI